MIFFSAFHDIVSLSVFLFILSPESPPPSLALPCLWHFGLPHNQNLRQNFHASNFRGDPRNQWFRSGEVRQRKDDKWYIMDNKALRDSAGHNLELSPLSGRRLGIYLPTMPSPLWLRTFPRGTNSMGFQHKPLCSMDRMSSSRGCKC